MIKRRRPMAQPPPDLRWPVPSDPRSDRLITAEQQARIAAKADRGDRASCALQMAGTHPQWSPEFEQKFARIMYRGVEPLVQQSLLPEAER